MALIKCPECKKEISSKAKSCPNCGYPINEKENKKDSRIKFVAAKCPNCGSNIEVNQDDNKSKCEYCHSTILVDDAIEKLKIELTGEVEVKNMPKFYLTGNEQRKSVCNELDYNVVLQWFSVIFFKAFENNIE